MGCMLEHSSSATPSIPIRLFRGQHERCVSHLHGRMNRAEPLACAEFAERAKDNMDPSGAIAYPIAAQQQDSGGP